MLDVFVFVVYDTAFEYRLSGSGDAKSQVTIKLQGFNQFLMQSLITMEESFI